MLRRNFLQLLAASLPFPAAIAVAAPKDTPKSLKIGTLYASSGPYSALSMPNHMGLKLWVDMENAKGGVMVKPYGKRIPIEFIAYDNQSNTATAATLYNRLITQDKVHILIADAGTVLTSVAVPIARNHKMFLFNPTGTASAFFTPDNPYIALLAMPASEVWPKYASQFITQEGPKLGIKRIALMYATNEFTGSMASIIRKAIKESKAPLEIVYDQGVPTSTSNYNVLINSISASKPDAVFALGYPANDIAFLRNLKDSGVSFNWVFTIHAGLNLDHVLETAGPESMKHTYTFVTSANIKYDVTAGMTLPEYRKAWDKAYPDTKVPFGFLSVTGYTVGIVLENALAQAKSLDQLDLREAVFGLSGKLKTLDGPFELDKNGAQIGEITPLGQFVTGPDGKLDLVTVYPPDLATGKPMYPAPKN